MSGRECNYFLTERAGMMRYRCSAHGWAGPWVRGHPQGGYPFCAAGVDENPAGEAAS